MQVGIVDVAASPYFYGMTPAEIQLVAPAFIESFKRAEKEGYDAVVPLGTLELGVDGGNSAVDIPVIGPTEAALHVASLVGDRFGLIVYHQSQMAFLRGIVRRYENFVNEAKRLIKQGAEVIIPMGISQRPVHIKPDWLQDRLGVPVVEAIGAPIRMAAPARRSRTQAEPHALAKIAELTYFVSHREPTRRVTL